MTCTPVGCYSFFGGEKGERRALTVLSKQKDSDKYQVSCVFPSVLNKRLVNCQMLDNGTQSAAPLREFGNAEIGIVLCFSIYLNVNRFQTSRLTMHASYDIQYNDSIQISKSGFRFLHSVLSTPSALSQSFESRLLLILAVPLPSGY